MCVECARLSRRISAVVAASVAASGCPCRGMHVQVRTSQRTRADRIEALYDTPGSTASGPVTPVVFNFMIMSLNHCRWV